MSTTIEKPTHDLSVDEIKDMIVQGKVSINDIIKSLVRTVAPKKRRKTYTFSNGNVAKTKEQRQAYYREYYKKNKERLADMYKQNRDVLNENSKKYYRLRKMLELEELHCAKKECDANPTV